MNAIIAQLYENLKLPEQERIDLEEVDMRLGEKMATLTPGQRAVTEFHKAALRLLCQSSV